MFAVRTLERDGENRMTDPIVGRLRTDEYRIAKKLQRTERSIARLSRREAAIDTRRRVLLGVFVLQEIEAGGPDADMLLRILRDKLPAQLSRDTDREILADLFGPGAEPATSLEPQPNE